jgi:hypothetical protein
MHPHLVDRRANRLRGCPRCGAGARNRLFEREPAAESALQRPRTAHCQLAGSNRALRRDVALFALPVRRWPLQHVHHGEAEPVFEPLELVGKGDAFPLAFA